MKHLTNQCCAAIICNKADKRYFVFYFPCVTFITFMTFYIEYGLKNEEKKKFVVFNLLNFFVRFGIAE